MRYAIQWRFIIKVALALVVLAVAMHYTHRWQMGKQVGIYLTQADRARDAAVAFEEKGQKKSAAAERNRERSYLERFLMARPNDVDARERVARLIVRSASNGKQLQEAFLVLEDVLRRDPSRDDLRRFTVDFLIIPQVGLYKEALGHAKFLNNTHPNDGELEGLLARCIVLAKDRQLIADPVNKAQAAICAAVGCAIVGAGLATGNQPNGSDNSQVDSLSYSYQDAADFYKKSIDHDPKLLSSYFGCAYIYRSRLNQEDEADRTIRLMILKNPKNFRAYLTAAEYWRESSKPLAEEEIVSGINFAIEEAPHELEAQFAKARLARGTARRAWRKDRDLYATVNAQLNAYRYLTRAREQHPEVAEVYVEFADLDADVHGVKKAIETVRQGLKVLPKSDKLLSGLIEYQFRDGDAAGAEETLALLNEEGLSPHLMDYEHARVLMLKEDWLEAARKLQSVIPKLPDNSPIQREASLFLGRCYEQLGDRELRLKAFTRALPLEVTDRLWVSAMVGLAEAQTALGLADEALRTYRTLSDWVPGAILSVARLEMLRAIQLSQDKPDWKAAESALVRAEKLLTEKRLTELQSLEVKVLQARLLSLRGNNKEARTRFEALVKESPKEISSWIELAFQNVREDKVHQALTELHTGEKKAGDSPELRLARAQVLAQAKVQDLAEKFSDLAKGIDKFPLSQQRRLLRTLYDFTIGKAGMEAVAGQLLEDLARIKPFDLSVHLLRFDVATRAKNLGVMEEAIKKIREIDGNDGQTARLSQATLLITQSQIQNRPELRPEALEILDGLERDRVGPPRSAKVALGQAIIHDMKGNKKTAREKYQQAIDLGEPNPLAIRRVMELMRDEGMNVQALAIKEKLPPTIAGSPEMMRLSAELNLKTDRRKEALQEATRAVPVESNNYADQLWAGRMNMLAGGGSKETKERFESAIKLAPDKMETWLYLMDFLIQNGQKKEAREKFDKAQDSLKKTLQESEFSLFLALGHAQLDDVEAAIKAYKRARELKPTDARILMGEAEYLLRVGKLVEAREGFKRVIDLYSTSPAEKAYARQRLALAMAADPDYATSRSGLEMLTADAGAASVLPDSPAQRRARAVIYALQKDRESRLEAIRLLEENAQGRSANEQFLLARLYLSFNKPGQVRVVMTDLLSNPKNRIPLYLSFYSMWLLRQNDLKEAEVWIKELETAAPGTMQTAELRARLAVAKKDLDGAGSILKPEVEKDSKNSFVVARICEEIDLLDLAEQFFKKFVDDNKAKEPRVSLVLVGFYGRQGRTSDALRLWEEYRSKLPAPQLGELIVQALYKAKEQNPDDQRKVADWLESTAKKAQGPEQAVLLQLLATVRNLQGDYAASEALYRQVVAANSRDALAMNNLAYLLSAFQNRPDEAIKWIEQARSVIGPHPVLLQTEAQIRLKKGEADKALKLIEAALEESPTASGYYTLARAQDQLKNDLAARLALQHAKDLGLQETDLHFLERAGYRDLKEKLKVK